MSVPNLEIKCTGCNFEASLARRIVNLIYQFPGGKELILHPMYGWCNSCDGIRYIEPNFELYFGCETEINELTKKVKSFGHRASKIFSKFFGSSVPLDEDENRLILLKTGLKIAKAINESSRCLACGVNKPGNVAYLHEYIHACGGHFVDKGILDDAPLFNYANISIYLDYEGREVNKFDALDSYVNLSKYVNIEGVFENGVFTGVLIFAPFDSDDFILMRSDVNIFTKFARIIELRIMHGDLLTPVERFLKNLSEEQKTSLREVPRVLVAMDGKYVGKWLRSQIYQ